MKKTPEELQALRKNRSSVIEDKKKNGKKYRAYEWAPKFKGIAVAHVGSHHMVAIRNGKVLDSWDSTDGIVGNYWTK